MRAMFTDPNRSLGLAILAVTACFTVACTDKVAGGDDADTATDEDGTAGETAGDGDGDGDGDMEIPDGPPARGISLTEVEANQGTAILIGKDGAWVGAAERNAVMIRDRDTLIRTQHVVDEGWIPREITGVLHLIDAEGNELSPRSHTFLVGGDSDPRDLSTEFYFSVLADEAQPGLSYWVELREASDTDVDSFAEGTNTTPEGFELVGYEQTALEMKVVLVPIHYTFIDPPTLVELTEEDLVAIGDDLLQTNPLQTVTLTVHEPHEYTNQLTNLGQLLSPMSALRGNEAAAPNVYYHALVDVNGPAVDMVAGIAQLTGDDKASGSSRVAATVWFKQGDVPPASSTGTMVHEIGHNQGLQHVFCPNAATEAAGPDANYPHEGGKIGVYGFGIRSFRLYTPTGAHDYMTYCGNAWVSDWTWNKTYQRVKTLTSWDYEGGEQQNLGLSAPLLVGTLFADGSEDWWVMQGAAPTGEQLGAEHRIALVRDGDVVDELYTSVSMLSDNETLVVTAPLPAEMSKIDALVRVDSRGDSHPVDLATLHVDHAVTLDIAR
jgi:Metallo-peptidase family M12B Reprolysin-like